MKILTTSIVAAIVMAGASAQAATYDFKAAANAGGGIGESAYTSFDTTSAFAGPGLTITAGDVGFTGHLMSTSTTAMPVSVSVMI